MIARPRTQAMLRDFGKSVKIPRLMVKWFIDDGIFRKRSTKKEKERERASKRTL